jgi:hypothetical protein
MYLVGDSLSKYLIHRIPRIYSLVQTIYANDRSIMKTQLFENITNGVEMSV